jgi:hypothetical protein
MDIDPAPLLAVLGDDDATIWRWHPPPSGPSGSSRAVTMAPEAVAAGNVLWPRGPAMPTGRGLREVVWH